MFRFSIRDVLWLTVVVGMGVAWCLDRVASARLRSEMQAKAAAADVQLKHEHNYALQWQAMYITSASELNDIREKLHKARLQVEGMDDSATVRIR